MTHYSVTIDEIRNQINNQQTEALMALQIKRAGQLLLSGKPLCSNLSGRFGFEIRLIYSAGQIILEKLENQQSSIYLRPRLKKRDKLRILWQSIF